MLVELYKIDKDPDPDCDFKISQELNSNKDNFTIKERDDNYIDTKSDTIKSDDIRLQEGLILQDMEMETDYSHLEVIRIDLENSLGEGILSKVYRIVEELVKMYFL